MAVVVVIGAGVGGLAVAVRLAAAGHNVTVCEQAPDVGGKLGWYNRDGFSFDTGPSLLTMPHVFDALFAAAGADLNAAVDLRRLDPIARYRFADGTTVDAHADDTAFAAELDSRLGDGAGAAWQRLDAHAARIWAAAEQPFVRSAVSAAALVRLAVHRPRDLATIAPGRTLRHLGRRHLADPRLRMFLDRYATYAGSDPRRAPAALAAIAHVERCYGGWYVCGGLHGLATALAELARARGARIRCATPVTAITLTAGGRVDGVRLADGHRLTADVVVANADAAQVYGSLVDDPRSRARVRRLPPSMSGFVLLLALGGPTRHAESSSSRRTQDDRLFPVSEEADGVTAFSRDPDGSRLGIPGDRGKLETEAGPGAARAGNGIPGDRGKLETAKQGKSGAEGSNLAGVREADAVGSSGTRRRNDDFLASPDVDLPGSAPGPSPHRRPGLPNHGRTPGLAHHTVLFPADYDAEFDAVFGGRLAADPTIYVSAPPDPALAPPGCEAWFVLVNAAPHLSSGELLDVTAINRALRSLVDRNNVKQPGGGLGQGRAHARSLGIDWDRPGLADAYAQRIIDLLAARGLDVRDRLLWYEVRTPADLERSTGTVGGSIYGPSSNGPRAAFLRPANASPVPGLFLVGGSSHPGGGLPLVAMSAHLVADLIGPA